MQKSRNTINYELEKQGEKNKKKEQWGTKNFLVDSYIFNGSWVFQKTHKADSYKRRKVLDPSYVNER